jgi:uncharacterized membrane protein YvbJ
MKYCTHCGAELVDKAVVCTKCGCAVGATGQIVGGISKIEPKLLVGIVALVLGIVGLAYSLKTILSNTQMNQVILTISLLVAFVGVISLKTVVKNKTAWEKYYRRVRLLMYIVLFVYGGYILYRFIHVL